MTSEHSKAWSHVRHFHAASEGMRKGGDHSSAHKRERKVERKKKEASSSDPGEEQQNQGEGQEKKEEEGGDAVFSGLGEKQQSQDEGKEEEEERVSVSANLGEERRDQENDQEGKKQEGASVSSGPEEEQRDQDESQERSPSLSLPNIPSEGVDDERLAQLRSQLQSQFSFREQEDQSPGSQLVELVERIVHREGDNRGFLANGEVGTEGQCPTCGQCSNPAGCSSGLPTEVEKTLQRELAVLKGEVTASIESMRREVAEELSSLREALQVYNEHHFFQAADLSPLEELDENIPNQRKGSRHIIPQGGKPNDKVSLEEQFKSRSVPTLHPLPISSRNQAMLRAAMSTITAKSGFGSNLSRSNSDPVEPMQAKSTIFPPAVPKLAARKTPAKIMPTPTTRTYASSGKYSNKMSARTLAPHPPCGDCEDNPH